MSMWVHLFRHLCELGKHHAGCHPKVTQEAMASMTLYPSSRRDVQITPKEEE